MQTPCINCEGRSEVVTAKVISGRNGRTSTAHVIEQCKVCQGRGSHDWRTGPGVDRDELRRITLN